MGDEGKNPMFPGEGSDGAAGSRSENIQSGLLTRLIQDNANTGASLESEQLLQ